MTILSAQSLLSDGQALTASAISENVMRIPDAGIVPREGAAKARNLGAGNDVPLLVQVNETFAGGTSVQFSLVTADNEALDSNATVLSQSPAIPVADLVAGYRPAFTRELPDAILQDYLGLSYTVAGTPTAGSVTAGLTFGVASNG